jgi:hypothetical protein
MIKSRHTWPTPLYFYDITWAYIQLYII